MTRHRPEGFDLPVAQGLAEPVLLMGMPRNYAILMGTIAVALGLGMRLWWLGLVWWMAAHACGVWAARSDRLFFVVLRRHLVQPAFFDV
jgi:type IV secretory pathway TrbD component